MPKGYRKIPRVSNRRRKIFREYGKMRLEFLKDHPSILDDPNSSGTDKCQCCILLKHRRIRRATQVHHRKGRGKYELVVSTWAGLCDWCHRFIHDHPAWAIERGLLINRSTPLSVPALDSTAEQDSA